MLLKLLKNSWFAWMITIIVTLGIYSGTAGYDILYDYDDIAYFEEPIVNLNLDHAGDYFTNFYLGMYQPVPVLTYAVVFKMFPGSVEAQRIINLAIHCLNLLLILIFVRLLTADPYIAFLTALLFAAHPMNVEFVTWFSTRSNLLYALFYLLSLILFLRWTQNQNLRNWLIMFVVFVIALLCKVTTATFPFIAILVFWYTGKRFDKKTLLAILPLFVVSCLFIMVGIKASSSFGHISDLGVSYTFAERIFILLHALWLYIYKAFIPIHQSVIYLYPWKTGGSIPTSYYITGAVTVFIILLFLASVIKFRKVATGKVILFGGLFFILALSIVLPLRWSRTILIAERYTYLPYIGLFLGIFMLIFRIKMPGIVRNALIILFTGTVILFAWMAHERTRVWESPLTLFTDVILKNRSDAEVSMAYYNRGNEYFRRKEPKAALSDYSDALRINPAYAEAWYNAGLVNFSRGAYPEAVRDFSKAIENRRDNVRAYVNRGTTYRMTGMFHEALADYNRAITIDRYPLAYFQRGILYYFNLNDPNQACSDWREALRLGYGESRDLLDKFCR